MRRYRKSLEILGTKLKMQTELLGKFVRLNTDNYREGPLLSQIGQNWVRTLLYAKESGILYWPAIKVNSANVKIKMCKFITVMRFAYLQALSVCSLGY